LGDAQPDNRATAVATTIKRREVNMKMLLGFQSECQSVGNRLWLALERDNRQKFRPVALRFARADHHERSVRAR
jgi:hypothetical protein